MLHLYDQISGTKKQYIHLHPYCTYSYAFDFNSIKGKVKLLF